MPGELNLGAARPVMHPLAARRILRLAFGTALSLWFCQAIAWPLSFLAPVLTMFILALPLPAPSLRKGLMLVVAMLAPMLAGMALLPFLHHARWVGILLMALALFHCFYYTARGGSAALGSFMTMGLTLMVTIGSVNSTAMFALIHALGIGAVSGLAFVWLAHAFLPDPICARLPEPVKRQTVAEKPQLAGARRRALRALLIVLPMVLLFLFMSSSTAYTVVMIKVAAMGQQASSEKGRELSASLLQSTLAGGAGAIVAWNLLSIWPSLAFYSLLIALAALIYGRGIFRGRSLHPKFSTWSYALLTMMVILAPAVLDSPVSTGAGAAFWSRFSMILLVALYGTAAVAIFDTFWPGPAVTQPPGDGLKGSAAGDATLASG